MDLTQSKKKLTININDLRKGHFNLYTLQTDEKINP